VLKAMNFPKSWRWSNWNRYCHDTTFFSHCLVRFVVHLIYSLPFENYWHYTYKQRGNDSALSSRFSEQSWSWPTYGTSSL